MVILCKQDTHILKNVQRTEELCEIWKQDFACLAASVAACFFFISLLLESVKTRGIFDIFLLLQLLVFWLLLDSKLH